MIKLTAKQEAFTLAVTSGLNLSDAYRSAGYSCRSMKTVNEAASRLFKNSKVAARIVALRKPIIERSQLSLENHIQILEEIRDKAVEKCKLGLAINAHIAIGRAAGFIK
ncbi:terminase small subunit [Nitrosomonas sp.]|uniref:terminase small subunit n=1 Tax=Nitrosomonas sp. TaxID=42353 RepID=UPI0025E5C024|nr:terminase small subunit [Nitrosomonas sp.]